MQRKSINNIIGIQKGRSICIVIGVLTFSLFGCVTMIEQKQYRPPVKFRTLPIPEVIVVYTNQGCVCERVRNGDCLSRVVERVLSRYIKEKGYNETYYFTETIYSVIKRIPEISLKNRNINLIYPGEVIRFRLPYKIILFEKNYYLPVKRAYGLNNLKILMNFKWSVDYKVDYFDCTERSAFVEFLLENYGFNTDIVGNENHCWVIVEVKPGRFVHIEAVASPPYIIDNKPYSYRFGSIFEALHRSATQYDWWNVAKENKQFINRRFSNN